MTDNSDLRAKIIDASVVKNQEFKQFLIPEFFMENLLALIAAETDRAREEAVYGFHKFIMGKNIIREEADQAYNYARLHRALDEYIAELKAALSPKKED